MTDSGELTVDTDTPVDKSSINFWQGFGDAADTFSLPVQPTSGVEKLPTLDREALIGAVGVVLGTYTINGKRRTTDTENTILFEGGLRDLLAFAPEYMGNTTITLANGEVVTSPSGKIAPERAAELLYDIVNGALGGSFGTEFESFGTEVVTAVFLILATARNDLEQSVLRDWLEEFVDIVARVSPDKRDPAIREALGIYFNSDAVRSDAARSAVNCWETCNSLAVDHRRDYAVDHAVLAKHFPEHTDISEIHGVAGRRAQQEHALQ